MTILEVKGVSKTYQLGRVLVPALVRFTSELSGVTISGQFFEKCVRLFQVSSVKSLGEPALSPAVDGCPLAV